MNNEVTAPMVPPWAGELRPRHWYRISGDCPQLAGGPTPKGTRYLMDNDPANDPVLNPPRTAWERLRRVCGRAPLAPWGGRMGFAAITEAWNGAIFASGLGQSGSMVLFGGGHSDYYGSDVHAFDLATRQWRRVSDGYVFGTSKEFGAGAHYPNSVYPDDSPLPPHTYGYVQYDPLNNDLLLLKGQLELGPEVKAVAIPHMFNLDTFSWRRGPQHAVAILNSGGCSAWDPNRRVLWGNSGDDGGGNAFLGFLPDGDNDDGTYGRWDQMLPKKLAGAANHNTMQMDPGRDRLIIAAHASDSIFSLDPADLAAPMEPLSFAVSGPTIDAFSSIEYSPELDGFYYFGVREGANLCELQRPFSEDPRWVQLAAGGVDPILDASRQSRFAQNPNHVFGRFRLACFPSLELGVLVRHIDSSVYAIRLQ